MPPTVGANPQFVAIEMPTAPKLPAGIAAARAGTTTTPTDAEATDPVIHIELRRGPLHMNVRWPTSAARDCATWLRDLGGLPK